VPVDDDSKQVRPGAAFGIPEGATGEEVVDAVAIASAVTTALGAGAPQGVTPGHKAGNLLGLRDVSASASGGGGCGCGGP